MNARKRNELLLTLVNTYLIEKKVNLSSSNTTTHHSRGMLEGACMAFECTIIEMDSHIMITTKKGKKLFTYQLN